MNTLPITLALGIASASSMANESSMLVVAGEPGAARNVERAAHWQAGLLGTYTATFDLGLLKGADTRNSEHLATPAHVARRSLSALLPGHQLPVVLDFTTIYEGTDGVVTHAGTVVGDDASLVTLSVQRNEVLGKIHTGGLLYLLEGSSEAGHLADLKPLSSNFTTFGSRCTDDILYQARDRVGAFSGVDTTLSNADADIALILVTTEISYDDCWQDVGRIGGVAFLHEEADPFALSTDTYALGDLTAVHEIGHVLGGDHEYGTANAALPNAYGFVALPSCAWQTLMGGYAHPSCPFDVDQPFPHLQPTTRLPRWSNPNQTYGGIAMGSSTQNMADALETLMPTVSAWETNPAAPGTASGFAVWSWLCYGTHTASWTATTGATHYQLMASTSVTFSSPYLIHIASGATSANFDIGPSETLYLRVRACNAGGCGGYSAQQVADDYYPICV